jgi:hypothetical protein
VPVVRDKHHPILIVLKRLASAQFREDNEGPGQTICTHGGNRAGSRSEGEIGQGQGQRRESGRSKVRCERKEQGRVGPSSESRGSDPDRARADEADHAPALSANE